MNPDTPVMSTVACLGCQVRRFVDPAIGLHSLCRNAIARYFCHVLYLCECSAPDSESD